MTEKEQLFILIDGVSGAGKSSLAKKLKKIFKDVSIISGDGYFKDRSFDSFKIYEEFNNPENSRKELLIEHLNKLLAGETVLVPHVGGQDVEVKPSKIIIVEGICVLQQPEIREMANLRIYCDADLDSLLIRKIMRSPWYKRLEGKEAEDSRNYGNNVIEALNKWIEESKLTYQHLKPVKQYADLFFSNNSWEEFGRNVWKTRELVNLYFGDKEKFEKELTKERQKINLKSVKVDKLKVELEEQKEITDKIKKQRGIWMVWGLITTLLFFISVIFGWLKKTKVPKDEDPNSSEEPVQTKPKKKSKK